MHEVLVNRLGGLSLPSKSVVRLTDRPDMTLDVYRGRKTTIQQNTNNGTPHLKSLKIKNSRAALGRPPIKLLGGFEAHVCKIPVRHEMSVLKNAWACVTYSKLFCCCHFFFHVLCPKLQRSWGRGGGILQLACPFLRSSVCHALGMSHE